MEEKITLCGDKTLCLKQPPWCAYGRTVGFTRTTYAHRHLQGDTGTTDEAPFILHRTPPEARIRILDYLSNDKYLTVRYPLIRTKKRFW